VTAPRPCPASAASPRRPAGTELHPAARLLWRSAREAQIELGSRAIVIDGVDTEAVRHVIGRAPREAPAAPAVRDLQRRLVAAGYAWPAAAAAPAAPAADGADDLRRVPPHPRLAAELTALSARVGQVAAELVNARSHCAVVVRGSGRTGPHIAALLAAAGVGRTCVLDTGPVRLHQAVPGGLTPADEGASFALAAAAAVQRVAADADCTPPPLGETPDLVVLATDEPVAADARAALHAQGCAHLVVRVAANRGSVGPLVLPGLTSCLRCTDLHRLERDPAWTALAVQLAVPYRGAGASEVTVATITAGIAAAQALEFLDGGRPATVEGSLELELPDHRVRRRSWPVHPDCDCMRG
jgi:ThiF family